MDNEIKLEKLVKQIEDTRIMLHNLISEKQYNLVDSKVIEVSQILDKLLSQYNSLK